MNSGAMNNVARQPPLPRSWTLGTDPQTLRSTFRFMAVVLVATGTLYSATVVVDFLRGQVGTRAIFAIGAAAQVIGGILVWRQPYPVGPDTFRKSWGIVAIAIGSSVLALSIQTFLGGLAEITDVLGLLALLNLVLGSVLLCSPRSRSGPDATLLGTNECGKSVRVAVAR